MLLSIYYLTVILCNTFGVATSPKVADLSTSFNGMNLNTSISNSVHLDCSWETSYSQPFVPTWSAMLHVPQGNAAGQCYHLFFFVDFPIVIIWHCVRWISGALNEHYLKF